MTCSIDEFYSKERPSDYAERLLQEVNEFNKEFHAFLNISKQLGNGFPFSSKANICVKGIETTAGSKMLEGYVPPFNATVIDRMLKTEYSFVGETSMDEFGFGTFGINCAVPARNASDKEYVPGGSSSGAAVATASMKYHVALAESTGGSISAPAAFNGVFGFTPTYGAVSRYGLIDYSNSMDKIGIISRYSDDARKVFDVIKGPDDFDMTCLGNELKEKMPRKLRIISNLLKLADERIRDEFERLLTKLETLGYKIEFVEEEALSKAIPAYYVIAMAEASTNLAKYNGYKYGLRRKEFGEKYNAFFTNARLHFGTEAKRRILLGTFVRSESVKEKYYLQAARVRRMIINALNKLLDDAMIIMPTMPILAPKIEDAHKLTPVQNYSLDVFTVPPNVAGMPHASFPYSYIDGMPLGAQIMTKQFNDKILFDFAKDWEKHFTYKFKRNLGDI